MFHNVLREFHDVLPVHYVLRVLHDVSQHLISPETPRERYIATPAADVATPSANVTALSV